ncbi:MAG: hypothetical protein WCP16_08825 [Pseudanabaena sp. ELA645]|jgi:hypothetical protein
MSTIHSYQAPVAKLINLKEDTRWDDEQWLDYVNQCGLSTADLPELRRLISDDALVGDDGMPIFCEIHVLRASVQIDPEAGIKLYIDQLTEFPEDDWLHEEIDGISRNAGVIAIAPFTKMLKDPTQEERLRVTFANGLEEIGKTHSEPREACVKALISQLKNYHVQDGDYLNSTLVSNLIELKAVEAVDLIEEVFTNRELDEWMTGSWAAAQVSLGLKQESDFSPEELAPKLPKNMLAIREMIDNLAKLREIEDKKKRSLAPKKPAAKGFGSIKNTSSSKKKKNS